jgi:hemerythrin-like domain-containing protein
VAKEAMRMNRPTHELTLSDALEQAHREIDNGIGVFVENPERGVSRPESLTQVLDALRRHIYLEEIFLFPPIRDAGMAMPVFVMIREHGELWRTMDALADLIADGSDMWRLADTCAQLLDQLHQHNSKEEPVIYSQADTGLPSHTRAELTRFIQTGRIHDGWVCEHAHV